MVGAVVSGSSGRNIEVVSITKWVYHRKKRAFYYHLSCTCSTSPLVGIIKLPPPPSLLPDAHAVASNVNSPWLYLLAKRVKEISALGDLVTSQVPTVNPLRGSRRGNNSTSVFLLEPGFQFLEGLEAVGNFILLECVHFRVTARNQYSF